MRPPAFLAKWPHLAAAVALAVPDLAALGVFGLLAHDHLIDTHTAIGLILTVITARAYGQRPHDGGGPKPPTSGVAVAAGWALLLLSRAFGTRADRMS